MTRNGAAPLKRIRTRRVADDVFERIRGAILERRFQPGERLDIPAMAAKLGVSQMPVRQAIGRLSDAGLIEIRPRSGTYVAQLRPREVAETFDIRRALERLAAESAVRNATEADVASLESLVAAMEAAVSDGENQRRHDELNTEFHRRILELSGNRKLISMYDRLNAHIKIARIHAQHREWRRRVDLEQQEHRRIAAAFRNRDAAELADALETHILRAKEALVADLESRSESAAAD